jgi:hypothetical protein
MIVAAMQTPAHQVVQALVAKRRCPVADRLHAAITSVRNKPFRAAMPSHCKRL